MKKLLLAFLLLPLYSAAQLEVGVNGGWLLGNTTPTVISNIGTVYGAGLYYRLTHVRFAVGYDANKMNISNDIYYTKPMSDVYAGVDYMWDIMYAGVQAGFTSIPAARHTEYNYFVSPYAITTTTSGSGIMYGMHLGFYFRIYNQLFVSAQAGYSVVKNTLQERDNMGYSVSYANLRMNMATLMLGLHYKFHPRHKRGKGK